MLVILAVLAWVFWYFFEVDVRNGVRWIRYGEMWIIDLFVNDDYTIPYQGQELNFKQGMENTPQWVAEDLRREHLSYFAALTMHPLKFFFMGLLGIGAIIVYFKGPRTGFRKTMSIETIVSRHSGMFPVISPFINFNPAMQPPRPPGSPVPAELPLFAEALGPEEWIAYNGIPIPDGIINEAAATRAFHKQLGQRWKGANALPPYKQILLAAFCLKASRKRDRADDLLGRLATCWSEKNGINLRHDKKLFKEAKAILSDKKLSKLVLGKINHHAFETTAMMRALAVAREEGGVMAPAQFVWLRAHDRTLWYPLNNMGRQSYHMEALGAMAHFKAEKLTDRPIPVPKLASAVGIIQEYMSTSKARPIPKLDYGKSKKRGIKKAR